MTTLRVSPELLSEHTGVATGGVNRDTCTLLKDVLRDDLLSLRGMRSVISDFPNDGVAQ